LEEEINMDIKQYINKLIETCKKENITDVEVYYSNSVATLINVVDNEVETFRISNDEGLNLNGNYEGKNSTTYIERFDDEALLDAVSNIKQTAPYNNKTKKSVEKSGETNNSKNVYNADNDAVIEKLKQISSSAKAIDPRVIQVPDCVYNQRNTRIVISDDKGNELEDSFSFVVGTVSVIVEEDGVKKDGYSFSLKKKFEDINYEELLKESIEEATSMLKAAPIASGSYDVIIRNDVFANILASFMSIFSAESIKKKTSKFVDKLNTQVAIESFNFIEDPMYQRGKINRAFDDEGTKTYKKPLIEKGVLKNILSSTEYEASTGNAFRNSYRENINISALNCYIEAGQRSTDEIVAGLAEAVVITSVDGLNAGINAISGDFSLSSNGYYIKDGKIDKSINQITIAGNLFELFNNIIEMSSDVRTSHVSFNFIESPSLLVKGLTVGGL
jgi:PmbA protein